MLSREVEAHYSENDLTSSVQDHFDMLLKISKGLGWGALLLLTLALAGWGSLETARNQCRAEAVASPSPSLPFGCKVFAFGIDHPAEAETRISTAELSALRISAISVYATILLGVIATLIGYNSFVVKKNPRSSHPAALDCQLELIGAGRELRGILLNPSEGAMIVRNLTVSNGHAVIQSQGTVRIEPHSSDEWTVIAGNSPLPPEIIVTGDVDRADGDEWHFEAEFAMYGRHYIARRLNHVRR